MLKRYALDLAADRRGATVIEYAVIAALISTAIIGGVSQYTTNVGVMYDTIAAAFTK